jgi:hypothetical protein
MALRFTTQSLPLTERILSSLVFPEKSQVILVQHGVRESIEFALALTNHLKKTKSELLFLTLPFSQDMDAILSGIYEGVCIVNPGKTYNGWIEAPGYLSSILSTAKTPVYLLEIGGSFASEIATNPSAYNQIRGIVDMAWENMQNNSLHDIAPYIPTYSLAWSVFLRIDARNASFRIYRTLDTILTQLHCSIADAKILIVWYGEMGQALGRNFSVCDQVFVADISQKAVQLAKKHGFQSDSCIDSFLPKADIILCATGSRCLERAQISRCKNGAILVSAGSKQQEIELGFLEAYSQFSPTKIQEFLTRYSLPNKALYLIHEGKNASFIGKSFIAPAVDLIYAETLTCLNKILTWEHTGGKKWKHQLQYLSVEERKALITKYEDIQENEL